MEAWKNAEKETAEFFGGLRRVRINYSEAIGDVIHPIYSIEVKYGKQIPQYLRVLFPTVLKANKKKYIITPSTYVCVLNNRVRVSTLVWDTACRKTVKFLEDAMKQAVRYNPELIPLVSSKPRGHRGLLLAWECCPTGDNTPVGEI